MGAAGEGTRKKGALETPSTLVPVRNATCYIVPSDVLRHAQLQLQVQVQLNRVRQRRMLL